VPEIDVFGVIAADEEIEKTIAVVVEPELCVRIDPRRKTNLIGDAREAAAGIVVI
jgi:hypothetical protein